MLKVYQIFTSSNRSLTCDGVSEVLVSGLSQKSDQSWNSVTVLDGNLVVRVFTIRNVFQCSTGRIVNL